jgi:hypothetical protein
MISIFLSPKRYAHGGIPYPCHTGISLQRLVFSCFELLESMQKKTTFELKSCLDIPLARSHMGQVSSWRHLSHPTHSIYARSILKVTPIIQSDE